MVEASEKATKDSINCINKERQRRMEVDNELKKKTLIIEEKVEEEKKTITERVQTEMEHSIK